MEELAKLHYGEYLECFDLGKIEKVKDVTETEEGEVIIEFREKADCCPSEGLIQNGYQNPLELLDHPAGGTITYLKFYRRRWKSPDSKSNVCNYYELRFPGTKLTNRFALFLKEQDRKGEIAEFFEFYPPLWNLIKEDLSVVQESSIGVRKPWYKRVFKKG